MRIKNVDVVEHTGVHATISDVTNQIDAAAQTDKFSGNEQGRRIDPLDRSQCVLFIYLGEV